MPIIPLAFFYRASHQSRPAPFIKLSFPLKRSHAKQSTPRPQLDDVESHKDRERKGEELNPFLSDTHWSILGLLLCYSTRIYLAHK